MKIEKYDVIMTPFFFLGLGLIMGSFLNVVELSLEDDALFFDIMT